MSMPAKLQIAKGRDTAKIYKQIVELYNKIDQDFSMYRPDSLINKYNQGLIELTDYPELKFILNECDRTKKETAGYFDIETSGVKDPTGLVKGYAISQAAKLLHDNGYHDFLVEIAGDIQTSGVSDTKEPWAIGIENPFALGEIIKVVHLSGEGIATSGTSIHKDHIINPHTKKATSEIASLSIIARDVYDADRYATAAFAMGQKGIEWVSKIPSLAGYMITLDHQGVMTNHFKHYV